MDDATAEAEASGGKGPDVIAEEEIKEEIEMIYDSANDPTAACNQPEMSATESLPDILKSSVTDVGDLFV